MNLPLPVKYLDATRWQHLPLDVLYAIYSDDEDNLDPSFEPIEVYQPVQRIPVFILCRTSDSEKRLEGALSSRVVRGGEWGSLFEVVGNAAVVGLVFCINQEQFCGSHVTPDGVTLLACETDIPPGAIMKELYDGGKIVRAFRVGPPTDDKAPHDVLIATKNRWFRNRINPKHLGFSKDEKV